jgi:hypothetical protein
MCDGGKDMHKALAAFLAAALGLNGLWMISAPFHWYRKIPGMEATGPGNFHLIRDVGCAYLITAVALLWLSIKPKRAWPAALTAAMFLILHASTHFCDAVAGRESLHHLIQEIPTVVLPGFLALWLSWRVRSAEKELQLNA